MVVLSTIKRGVIPNSSLWTNPVIATKLPSLVAPTTFLPFLYKAEFTSICKKSPKVLAIFPIGLFNCALLFVVPTGIGLSFKVHINPVPLSFGPITIVK